MASPAAEIVKKVYEAWSRTDLAAVAELQRLEYFGDQDEALAIAEAQA